MDNNRFLLMQNDLELIMKNKILSSLIIDAKIMINHVSHHFTFIRPDNTSDKKAHIIYEDEKYHVINGLVYPITYNKFDKIEDAILVLSSQL